MTKEISNYDDMIDVRDIIERYEELRAARRTLEGVVTGAKEESDNEDEGDGLDAARKAYDEAKAALAAWDIDQNAGGETPSDDKIEMDILEKMLDELKGNGGDHQWEGNWYPVTLIRHDHFNDSMDEMLEDIGEMPKWDKLPSYITITVDYDALKMDYSEVDYDGVEYLYR